MKKHVKVLIAVLSVMLLFAMLAGSALAVIDGRAYDEVTLQEELDEPHFPNASKTITFEDDIDYRRNISFSSIHYTFNLNNHILNVTSWTPLRVYEGRLDIIGGGEFNVITNKLLYGIDAAYQSHVTVNNVISSNLGVKARDGSTVTVNGKIDAPVYIELDGVKKDKADGVKGTGADKGYTIYTNGFSTVRVKDPVVPSYDWYSVSYHPNGALGSVAMDMNRYYRGDKVELSTGEGMTWPGYEFAGWELRDGTPVTEPFIMGDGDVTLFATWR